MPDPNKKYYHHDYYFGPEGMTEHDDWRQSSYDLRNQRPDNYQEEHGSHEPIHVSDQEIRARVEDLLAQDPAIDHSEVEVDVHMGSVRLTGTIPSRWAKQKINADIAGIAGVSNIENDLAVDRPADREVA